MPNTIGVSGGNKVATIQIPPTKRQRLSLTQSKESASDKTGGNWSQYSVCSNMTISLISENSMQEIKKTSNVQKRRGDFANTGAEDITEKMVHDFEIAV